MLRSIPATVFLPSRNRVGGQEAYKIRGIREWPDWLVGLSGRMNPDPRDKTRKARLWPSLLPVPSPTVARSRNRAITFLFPFSFSLRFCPLLPISCVCLYIAVHTSFSSFSCGTSMLPRPDFFLSNVSKTIGGPRIIARANQSRIEFRDFPLCVEPSGAESEGPPREKEKRDRRGTK